MTAFGCSRQPKTLAVLVLKANTERKRLVKFYDVVRQNAIQNSLYVTDTGHVVMKRAIAFAKDVER